MGAIILGEAIVLGAIVRGQLSGGVIVLLPFKHTLYAVFCLFTLGRHGNFTAGVIIEQPDLL